MNLTTHDHGDTCIVETEVGQLRVPVPQESLIAAFRAVFDAAPGSTHEINELVTVARTTDSIEILTKSGRIEIPRPYVEEESE